MVPEYCRTIGYRLNLYFFDHGTILRYDVDGRVCMRPDGNEGSPLSVIPEGTGPSDTSHSRQNTNA